MTEVREILMGVINAVKPDTYPGHHPFGINEAERKLYAIIHEKERLAEAKDLQQKLSYVLGKTTKYTEGRYEEGNYYYWRGGADTRKSQKIRAQRLLERVSK